MNNKKFLAILAAAATVFTCAEAQDLGGMLGNATGDTSRSKQRDDEIPTEITAMTMDIDVANNVATLTGDVVVDDQEMTLTCDKMVLHLEDRKAPPAGDGVKAEPKAENGVEDAAGNKQLKSIVCTGNVVMIRKQVDESTPEKAADEARKAQQAFAGKAVYDFAGGKIILTENPLVNMGQYTAKGDRITVFINEEYRTLLEGKAKITARGLKRETVSPAKAESPKDTAAKE